MCGRARGVCACLCARVCACVCVCLCASVPARAVCRLPPPPRPASSAPRGASTTRAPARTVRAACVPLCPPTPAPALPRVSCCGAGGSKSAVSAVPGGRRVPWGGRGRPTALYLRGSLGAGWGLPGTLAGPLAGQASASPGRQWGARERPVGKGAGVAPWRLTPPPPHLCRRGRGLLPQLPGVLVQPDHLPAHLPLALRGRRALPAGLRARGWLRLPRRHPPGREGPLRAPGPVLLLPPWSLPGGRGGGAEAGGALVGGLGWEGEGPRPRATGVSPPPRALPARSQARSPPPSSPQRLPERETALQTGQAARPE